MLEKVHLTTDGVYRYYTFKGKRISKICIFDETGIIATIKVGWFETKINGFNQDVKGITITEPKMKRKVDFKAKNNFIVKDRNDWSEKINTLYLMASEIDCKLINEDKLLYETDTYEVRGKEFSLNIDTNEFNIEVKTETVEKDFGKLVKETYSKLHKEGIKIESYVLENLLKKYDLVEKKD